MINDLKRVIKLIKYGFNLKINLICAFLFFLFGLVYSIFIGVELGFLELMLGPIFIIQISSCLEYAGIIGSSPLKRSISIHFQNIFGGLVALCSYLLSVIIYFFRKDDLLMQEEQVTKTFLVIGLFSTLLLVYMTAAFRSFVVSTCIFAIGFAGVYYGENFISIRNLSTGGSVLIGLLLVLVGIALSVVVRKLLYKKQISRYAAGASLRKYL